MVEKTIKTFYLKGELRNLQTGEKKLLVNQKIQGTSGANAIIKYNESLKAEGIYELIPNYTYCQEVELD